MNLMLTIDEPTAVVNAYELYKKVKTARKKNVRPFYPCGGTFGCLPSYN